MTIVIQYEMSLISVGDKIIGTFIIEWNGKFQLEVNKKRGIIFSHSN